uniref:Uncharacterized protein n=1 Tax=uncultured prokaryote TaxID=198431 RepID=A0A0H5Q5L5_9ZZZZ|nr:hypothetical protein [uncultured prokaryote]
MAMTRFTAVWSGFRGAPGYSNFYFGGDGTVPGEIEADAARIRTFFNDIRDLLPTGLSVRIQPEAATIDETTGNITDLTAFDAPSQVIGGTNANYSAASGAVVNWLTGTYVNGRRLRGKTFLVPLTTSAYDGSGDLTGTALGTLQTAANDLVGEVGERALVVWSRPKNGSGGQSALVVSATVPDLGAILKSRRD